MVLLLALFGLLSFYLGHRNGYDYAISITREAAFELIQDTLKKLPENTQQEWKTASLQVVADAIKAHSDLLNGKRSTD